MKKALLDIANEISNNFNIVYLFQDGLANCEGSAELSAEDKSKIAKELAKIIKRHLSTI
jgi:hypothetical protein